MRQLRPEMLAALSGVILGLGVSVLLQQFGVWVLDLVTLVILPLAVGGTGAIVVAYLRRRNGGVPS